MMAFELRRRTYAGATAIASVLALTALLLGALPRPVARDPFELRVEDFWLKVAAGSRDLGLSGRWLPHVLARIPADPKLRWLRPVIANELTGNVAPVVAAPDPIADLYRDPPRAAVELDAVIDKAVPYPYVRLRLRARAAKVGGNDELATRIAASAARSALVTTSRMVVLSSYFLFLFAAGVALIAATLLGRSHRPPPTAAPVSGEAAGVFAVWLASHLVTLMLVPLTWSFIVAQEVRFALLTVAYVGVGIGATLLARRWVAAGQTRRLLELLGLRGDGALIGAGLLGLPAAVPAVAAAVALSGLLLPTDRGSQNPVIPALLDCGPSFKLLLLALVGVAAPLVEETMFRGLLYPAMAARIRPALAIPINGLLFALVHADLPVLLPLLALGSVLAYLRHRTGSVLPGMITHGLWNLQTFGIVLFLFGGSPSA